MLNVQCGVAFACPVCNKQTPHPRYDVVGYTGSACVRAKPGAKMGGFQVPEVLEQSVSTQPASISLLPVCLAPESLRKLVQRINGRRLLGLVRP